MQLTMHIEHDSARRVRLKMGQHKPVTNIETVRFIIGTLLTSYSAK